MEQAFYFSRYLTDFLFQGLNVSSYGGIIGIGILTGFLPILFEVLHLLRDFLAMRRISSLDVNNVSSETVHLRTGLKPFSILNRSLYLSIQTCLYMLELLSFYIVMLSLSTYNAWLLIALIIGSTVAYYTLQPLIQLTSERRCKPKLGIQTTYSAATLDSIKEDRSSEILRENLPSVSSCH